MRMIEFMPLDSGRAWLREHVVPGSEILERVQAEISVAPLPLNTLQRRHPVGLSAMARRNLESLPR